MSNFLQRPANQENTSMWFDVFSTVHHSIKLFHQPTLMHNFLYSLTICLLHYYPRHASSINMPIFKRKNCIHTASGIFALCKRLHSTPVESGLQFALNRCTGQLFTESDDTRCCENTNGPPEDGHVNARNMSRISPLSTGVLGSRLQRVTIPDAVRIQMVLLKMGMLML